MKKLLALASIETLKPLENDAGSCKHQKIQRLLGIAGVCKHLKIQSLLTKENF